MIAKHSRPDRISYANRERHSGLLHLRVDHSAMATELQHLEPQLLERINGYFGFKAVAKMRFIHGPLTDQPAAEGLQSCNATRLAKELKALGQWNPGCYSRTT